MVHTVCNIPSCIIVSMQCSLYSGRNDNSDVDDSGLFSDVDDRIIILVTLFVMSVTSIKSVPRSQSCHQHILSPTSVTVKIVEHWSTSMLKQFAVKFSVDRSLIFDSLTGILFDILK